MRQRNVWCVCVCVLQNNYNLYYYYYLDKNDDHHVGDHQSIIVLLVKYFYVKHCTSIGRSTCIYT